MKILGKKRTHKTKPTASFLYSSRFCFGRPQRAERVRHGEEGFTKFSRTDYLRFKTENRIMPDGVNAKLLGCHGPLANRRPGRAFLDATA